MLALILHYLVIIAIFVILTLSLNLIIGFTGQVSLGHAAFFGIGAYTSAILLIKCSAPFPLALLAAAFLSGIAGVLLGIPTLRLKDDYLAIVTLGFGVILVILALNVPEQFMGGTDGLSGIPGPILFGKKIKSKFEFVLIAWFLVFFTIFFMYRIQNSRIGRALNAIRDSDITAQVMGINSTKYKVMAFGIGSAFAGIAGALYGSYIHYIQPHVFDLSQSIKILCMLVLGGMGSIPGSIIGAVTLSIIPELLRKIPAYYVTLVYGLLLIIIIIIRPQGIMGKFKIKR